MKIFPSKLVTKVSTRMRRVLVAAGLLLAVAATPANALGPNAIRPGFDANEVVRNDDGSTGLVDIGFPVDFFGTTYDFLYVNNNGNVTLDYPLSTYTPFDLNSTNQVIVAAFFADVDTRSSGEPVRYGAGTVGGRAAFGVSWRDVDCYYSDPTRAVRNFFQLLLIERGDREPGDFDIEFDYDQIEWETGTASGGTFDCLGGASARVGYANGEGTSFELPGSGVPGTFLDSNPVSGLIHNSLGTAQLGRYVFEVHAGTPPGGSISGTVLATTPVAGAMVQACAGGFCRASQSDAAGVYSVDGLLPGEYQLRALPPAGSHLNPGTAGPVVLTADEHIAGIDILLTGPMAPPVGTSIEPSGTGSSGLPSVYWRDVLTLITDGCPGGDASFVITGEDGAFIDSGTMSEAPSGTYNATVGPLYPRAGSAHVSITIDCPSSPQESVDFDMYIDPSGVVRTTSGIPIEGATVTLFRADDQSGQLVQVADGAAVMSPSNRTNPDATDSLGRFGWDVIAGFYVVRAQADGCVSPNDPAQPYVQTVVLTIPPPVTDLVLELDCGDGGGPRVLTQGARNVLASALPTGDDRADRRIAKAIDGLDDALSAGNWLDDETLDPAHGKSVFSAERKAAKQLERVATDAAAGSSASQTALALLVQSDATLASTAIADAINAGGDQEAITKAQATFSFGDATLAAGDFDKAVLFYGKAWRQAMKAVGN